jgi:hypothetical protein
MSFSTRNMLSKESLMQKISSYQIFKAYCKHFVQVGKSFKSEFRDEKSPSCMIERIGGDLLYTDFGEGSYYAIEYVMRKYACGFFDAMSIINQDFSLGLIDHNANRDRFAKNHFQVIKNEPVFSTKQTTEIAVRYSKWQQQELDYWLQFGWSREMLDRASIRPIDFYWLTIRHKGIIEAPYAVHNELAFSYDYYRHLDIFRRKLYFPEREGKFKWLSNVDNTIIQNWDLLPKEGGDLLFIASSKKDAGVHWRLNGHYCNACAPNNEGSFLPEPIFYHKIRPRWKRIVAWLDNDSTGIKNALKWAQKYQIEAVWNPERCPLKDQSDFVSGHGLREFNYLQNKLIYGL